MEAGKLICLKEMHPFFPVIEKIFGETRTQGSCLRNKYKACSELAVSKVLPEKICTNPINEHKIPVNQF